MDRAALLFVSVSLLTLSGCAQAAKTDSTGGSATATATVQYSPYLEGDHTPVPDDGMRPYYGDTHLHTAWSTDAGMVGNNLGPDDAYRFARGEEVTSSNGTRARLQRPLDFVVIADHAENLGLTPMAKAKDPVLAKSPFGKKIMDLLALGTLDGQTKAYEVWAQTLFSRDDQLKAYPEIAKSAWQQLTEAAERNNQPGKFTAFIGFEWTSGPSGNNLHRNVVFRDGKALADTIVPLSTFDTENPEDLWRWMSAYEAKTGGRMLAIPHNGNLSSGTMFDDVKFDGKSPIDRAWATERRRWEPVYEVTQMKGDGETHPALSGSDEFADFERWDVGGFGTTMHNPGMLPREYAREAYKRGLAYEEKLGVNPFKFGMVGSTDAHTSLSSTQEDNFFGKVSALEPSADPVRFDEVIVGRFNKEPERQKRGYQTSASGLAAVWAKSNTRQDIWDAFARREVFATTGTRIRVRVFAGYDFKPGDLKRADFARYAYSRGVPMGGDLRASNRAPTLLIQAMKDPDWANLDRVQVVKGWLGPDGKTYEKVHDVAWSGNRKPSVDGKLPAVGNTVNVKDATYNNSIGAREFSVAWTDPAFDPKQKAFYYVRVLEIPTPRWTTFDAKFFKKALPKGVPTSIQERAYTSPIWYTPA